MTYRVWEPAPPNGNLQQLSDQELKIVHSSTQGYRAVWNLKAIQQGLASEPSLVVNYSPKTLTTMADQLNWQGPDVRQFISVLTSGHYDGSSWCYAPKGNTSHAADVYRMGFNRILGLENQKLTPWAYVKFAMVGPKFDKLFIFSAHAEGQF